MENGHWTSEKQVEGEYKGTREGEWRKGEMK